MAGQVTNFPTLVTSTCDALLGDRTGLAILAQCSTTPPTTANAFAVGCIMQRTDNNTIYENNGTVAVPIWNPISIVGQSGVFVSDGNGTTLVRLGGSPSANTNFIVTAVEVTSLDANGGQTITFSNGCAAQNVTVKQGSLGAVTGSSGASMPVTTSGCFGAASSGSALFVAKAYFKSPTS